MVEQTLQQAIEQIHASQHKLVLEFAGAGSLALFWLHSVPGSSRTILEATDRYAPTSLTDLLGNVPEQFVARETAIAMAAQAYRRAMRLAVAGTDCLGVACTAAIATDRTRRGEDRCWIAVRDRDGVSSYGLVMDKHQRERTDEELLVSQLLLRAIAESCGIATTIQVDTLSSEQIEQDRQSEADPLTQLLEGKARTVTVAPDGIQTVDQPVTGALLSGSFNPLHAGHERLAAATTATLNMPVIFELPIFNADKAPLGYAEIERRLAQFRWRFPVVLSSEALFIGKAKLFPGCVFVLGYDTAVRIVNPRYYGGEAARDEALAAIRAQGCRFLVAGRLANGVFQTVRDIAIPAGFEDLLIELPEAAFRVDLSSTMIRAQMQG